MENEKDWKSQGDGYHGPNEEWPYQDPSTLPPQPPMGPCGGKLIRTVSELMTMPYGMRLSRGFAILSGNKHDL